MASKGGASSIEAAALGFCKLATPKTPNELTTKSCGKMAGDCWGKKFGGAANMVNICDTSVFPHVLSKTGSKKNIPITESNMKLFMDKTAHEVVKRKLKTAKEQKELQQEDDRVKEVRKQLEDLLIAGAPNVKETKISATGGVDKMTDHSQYTGSHKERFDASGKGKGSDGRVDKVDASGYVGAYKGEGTYDKK